MLTIAADPVPVYYERMAILLGITSLVLLLVIFSSCRVFSNVLRHFDPNFARRGLYQTINKFHAVYWWILGVGLVSHIMMAVSHTGLPQADDPDAGTHWAILFLGLTSAASAVVLFTSCRVSPRLLTRGRPENLFEHVSYKLFYRNHAYYWLLLALAVGAHFTVGYIHAGIWPG